MAFINPELIQSSEQVELLRNLEIAMLEEHQRFQTIHLENEIEKMRLPVAFADMLYRRSHLQKLLYLTAVPSGKDSVQQSFRLHTSFQSIFIQDYLQEPTANEQYNLVLSSLLEFSNACLQADDVEQFLGNFDFVIVEHSELKLYDLISHRLKNIFRGRVLELVYHPQILNL